MTIHFNREIEIIKKQLVRISAEVEKSVTDAVRALEKKDIQLAQKVIDNDEVVDALEVELEEECLKLLALHQPVAIDLRYSIAILKINNDLERIGDLAVNIAQGAHVLSRQTKIRLPQHISTMASLTITMLHKALDSVLNLESDTAREVLAADDEIDDLHLQTYRLVETHIQEEPTSAPEYIRLLGISRNLERIADHTTNIAEDVLYMTDGEIIRHNIGGVDGG